MTKTKGKGRNSPQNSPQTKKKQRSQSLIENIEGMSYDSIYTELANIKQEILPIQSMQKDIDNLKNVIMKLNDKIKEKDEKINQLENSINSCQAYNTPTAQPAQKEIIEIENICKEVKRQLRLKNKFTLQMKKMNSR